MGEFLILLASQSQDDLYRWEQGVRGLCSRLLLNQSGFPQGGIGTS